MQNSKMTVQLLRGNKAQIVLAFFFARCALDVQGLQEWTGLERHTINNNLRLLEVDGFVAKQIGEHGRRVWLTSGDLLFQMEGKLPSGFATTTTTLIEERQEAKAVVVVKARQMEGKLPSVIYETYGVTFESNMNACRKNGIGEPKASRICALPHVSPQFISDHIESLNDGDSLGLAILRIESNEAPRVWLDKMPSRDELKKRKRGRR